MKGVLALLAALILVFTTITPALGYTKKKVVIVVGPVGGTTETYRRDANTIANEARRYNTNIVKIYSPYATWSKVKDKAKGADIFIYLGHGNGWPSPYAPYSKYTKNGLGLNRSSGHGDYNVRYFGAYYVKNLRLAKNAIVILHHVCFASGGSATDRTLPSLSTAIKRVDNYAAPFISAGAKAVFAYAWPVYTIINKLFTSNKTMREIFWAGPYASPWSLVYKRQSVNRPKYRLILDPYYRNQYYRSIVAKLNMTASYWRASN